MILALKRAGHTTNQKQNPQVHAFHLKNLFINTVSLYDSFRRHAINLNQLLFTSAIARLCFIYLCNTFLHMFSISYQFDKTLLAQRLSLYVRI